MTFGSLFAGIGGFDLGLERAGMTCAWQVEREPYAVRVLEKHWPNVRRHDDVCTFPPEEGNWDVDLVCGGFPCQDISVAGKGAGLAGERSGLWHEMHRIIGELRPRFVIVENVAALLSRGMETVLGELSEIGYDAEWHVIPASAVGAPHRRERVWIVADANSGCLHWSDSDAKDGATIPAERQQREFCGGDGGGDVPNAVSERDAVRRYGASVPPAVAFGGRDAGGSVSDCGAGCSQEPRQGASDVADAKHDGFAASKGRHPHDKQRARREKKQSSSKQPTRSSCRQTVPASVSDADRGGLEKQRWPKPKSTQHATAERCGWWETEPAVGRVVDGLPYRVDRLRGLGNAVVPQVVELIGRAIIESLGGPA